MKFRPKFMAFCLAGMPHRDVEEACQVMLNNFPEVPIVPRLSSCPPQNIFQGMPCLNRGKGGPYFELAGREGELVEFYERYLSGEDHFDTGPELEPPLYKLAEMFKEKPWPQLKLMHFFVPGPYTYGFVFKDEKDAPAFYNDTLRDVMVKQLTMRARWRERKIKELFPGVPTLFHISEAGLGVYTSAGGTGSWDAIKNAINEVLGVVEGITCIHCCDNFDWSLLMETDIDCINFDAYHYGDTMSLYPDALKRFLERGGMIAWGAVPTGVTGDIENENPGSLMKRLEEAIRLAVDKGIDRELLLESSWITPSCDTTTMSVELAERVYAYTRELSQRMREKYFG